MNRIICVLLFLMGGAFSNTLSAKDGGQPDAQACEANANPCCNKCNSSSAPITINVSPSQSLENKPGESGDSKPEKSEWERWTGIGTVAMAVFTAMLAAFSLWQRYDLKDASGKELRAYLGVRTGNVKILYPSPNHLQAIVEVHNTGSTPAHHVTKAIRAEIRDANHTDPFPMPERQKGRWPIVPGAYWTFRCDLTEKDGIDQQIVQDLSAYKKFMFVWGSAEYDDEFGFHHVLEFRYRTLAAGWSPIAQADGVVTMRLDGWVLEPEEEGNSST